MKVYLGADHRGFALKEKIKEQIQALGHEVNDEGAAALDSKDDYPVYAKKVAEKVAENPGQHRGIVICGSGIGVDIVANKFRGIRSALVFNDDMARKAREHDNTNVLALAADYLSEDEALKIVKAWLETPFSGEERHRRRIQQIEELEGA